MSKVNTYLSYAKAHPALFANSTEGGFTILLTEEGISQAEVQAARALEAQGLPTEWAQVGIVYQDQYLLAFRDAVRYPDGSLGTYIRLVRGIDSTPGVVILTSYRGRILLLNHFRHATRAWHLEIPRGFGVKDSSSEENAQRVLKEELGAVISHMFSLGHVHPDAGTTSDCIDLFYAEIAAYSGVDTHEAIGEILPMPVPEFERLITDDRITDSFTIVAYMRAKLQGLF